MKDKKPRDLTRVEKRHMEASASIASEKPENIAYQHTVLCQTGLPYRNPGDEVRVWEREQGNVALRIEAGVYHHPETNQWVELGLPFGPKVRLILAYLNAEALRTRSPKIEVERSLTAFVRRLRGGKGAEWSRNPCVQGTTEAFIFFSYPYFYIP